MKTLVVKEDVIKKKTYMTINWNVNRSYVTCIHFEHYE